MNHISAAAEESFAGTWLRRRRTEALLTHERLSTLTGVDARVIRDIETGEIPRPPADVIRLLLDTLETADRTVLR